MATIDERITEAEECVTNATATLTSLLHTKARLDAGIGVDEYLATIMHSKTCRLSHMDQCGWEHANTFEDGPHASERMRHLKKAQALLKILNGDLNLAIAAFEATL